MQSGEIIYKVIEDMSSELSKEQLFKLQSVLIHYMAGETKEEEAPVHDNESYLYMFEQARRVEGLSERTIGKYRRAMERLLDYLDNIPIPSIKTEQIRDVFLTLKNERHCSKATLDTFRRELSAVFSWLHAEGYLQFNAMSRIHKIKPDIKVKSVFSDEELERIRCACRTNRELAIIDFLCTSGVRVGELINLDKKDIDFVDRECVVYGKGSKERIVYFDARTKVSLMQYLEERTDDESALFVSDIKPYRRLSTDSVERIVSKIGKLAGVQDCHPHKFRTSFATKSIDKGMPVEHLKQMMGHTSLETTMIYAQVKNENVKQSHKKYIG